jgi:hypothetical protein
MAKGDKRSWIWNIFIVAVIALWGAAMGVYFARQKTPRMSPPPLSAAAPQAADLDQWMGVYLGRTKIGYVFSRLRQADPGYELWAKSRLKIKMAAQDQDIFLDLQGRLDPDYSVRRLEFELLASGLSIRVHGERQGDNLDLTIGTGGEEIKSTLHFQHPPTLEYEWALRDQLKSAKIGDEFASSFFEPLTQSEMPIRVRIEGEEELTVMGRPRPCWKAQMTLKNQSEWIWAAKDDGAIVKEFDQATGLTSLLETREEAMNVDWAKAGETDLMVTLMVPADREINDPRAVTHLKARLVGAPLTGLATVSPGRQTLAGDEVEVTMEAALPAQGYTLPLTRTIQDKATELGEWLKPTPLIQSDHPKVQAAAAEARGDAADAVAATDRLIAYTAKNVEDSLVVSVPSALEVLEKKRGACKEHTVLFVALARASGIPARVVSGIVYSDQMMISGFYYHAWAEVWLAGPDGPGAWIAVDPTFNQVPADATHIKLVEGDLDKMLDLMQVMGKLQVKVEAYQ